MVLATIALLLFVHFKYIRGLSQFSTKLHGEDFWSTWHGVLSCNSQDFLANHQHYRVALPLKIPMALIIYPQKQIIMYFWKVITRKLISKIRGNGRNGITCKCSEKHEVSLLRKNQMVESKILEMNYHVDKERVWNRRPLRPQRVVAARGGKFKEKPYC